MMLFSLTPSVVATALLFVALPLAIFGQGEGEATVAAAAAAAAAPPPPPLLLLTQVETPSLSSSTHLMFDEQEENDEANNSNLRGSLKRNLEGWVNRKVLIEIKAYVPELTYNDLMQLATSLQSIYNNINPCSPFEFTDLLASRNLHQRIDEAIILYENGVITHGRFTLLVGVTLQADTISPRESLFTHSDNGYFAHTRCSVPLASKIENGLNEALMNSQSSIGRVLQIQELVPVPENEYGGRQLNEITYFEMPIDFEYQLDSTESLTEEQKITVELAIKAVYNQMNQGATNVHDPNYRVLDSVEIIEDHGRRLADPPNIWLNCNSFGHCMGCPNNEPLGNDGNGRRTLLESEPESESDKSQALYDVEDVIGYAPELATEGPPSVSMYFDALKPSMAAAVPFVKEELLKIFLSSREGKRLL